MFPHEIDHGGILDGRGLAVDTQAAVVLDEEEAVLEGGYLDPASISRGRLDVNTLCTVWSEGRSVALA
jgi:hypothetical protein